MLFQSLIPHDFAAFSLTEKLSQLYQDLSSVKDQKINLMSISKLYQMRYYRVSDFFEILQVLGFCYLVDRKLFFWKGLDFCFEKMIEKYSDFELQCLSDDALAIFSVEKNSSLGKISLHLIFLSLFLGSENLNLRTILKILGPKEINQQNLRRRIYLVLTFLKICGIVKQKGKTGEFSFILPKEKFYSKAMNERKAFLSSENPLSIESIMNRLDGIYLNSIQRNRIQFIANQ
jgi:hypothetical protein